MARRSAYFVTVMLLVAGSATAADEHPAFTIFAAGGRSMQNWHGQATFKSIHFEWSRPYRWKTQIAFDFAPYAIVQPRSWFGDKYHDGNENVDALGAAVILRRVFRPQSALRTYAELGTGPMLATERVPEATSHFNMATQGGLGILITSPRGVGLYAGYRFTHISNGGIAHRNPGYNVHGVVIGSRLVR